MKRSLSELLAPALLAVLVVLLVSVRLRADERGRYVIGTAEAKHGASRAEEVEEDFSLSLGLLKDIFESPICEDAFEAQCGAEYNGDTSGASSLLNSYACVEWDESGPEHIYRLTLGSVDHIAATLSDLSADLDAFLLTSCDLGACASYGNSGYTFLSPVPGEYFLVVDGYQGAQGSYKLNIECGETATPTASPTPTSTPTCTSTSTPTPTATPTLAPLLDCEHAIPAQCWSEHTGRTSHGLSNVDGYGCVGWDESGPEMVYRLSVAAVDEIRVTLSDLAGDLDAFLLSSCDEDSCLAFGDTGFRVCEPYTRHILCCGRWI